MGDFGYEFDDDEQDERGDGPADLRKAHRAATRKIKELESKITELTGDNAKLSKRVRHLDIGELLPKGVSPKVAKLIPDTVEPTADAVKAWLDEFGDVFNVKADDTADTASDQVDNDEPGDDTPQVDKETLAALAAFQQVSAGGTAVPQGALSALMADAASADVKTPEEGLALLRKHGLETVNGY
jgi:hypothetical protein